MIKGQITWTFKSDHCVNQVVSLVLHNFIHLNLEANRQRHNKMYLVMCSTVPTCHQQSLEKTEWHRY